MCYLQKATQWPTTGPAGQLAAQVLKANTVKEPSQWIQAKDGRLAELLDCSALIAATTNMKSNTISAQQAGPMALMLWLDWVT
jgi:hypothetical protein